MAVTPLIYSIVLMLMISKGLGRSSRALTTQLRAGSQSAQQGHAYFIATPIGNLGDITLRAVEVLSSADIICAEDTRHTRKLLKHLDITPKRLVSHHEHNAVNSAAGLIDLLREGNSVALVSDAGTPGISDPGTELAAACARQNIPVHPIPGPSAVVSALSVCGFNSNTFTFVGFLPVKGKSRTEKLEEIRTMKKHCVVLYEAPHRMIDTMIALQELNRQRPICICRELTKIHEEISHGTVEDSLQQLVKTAEGSPEGRLRGEFCLVLGPVTENKSEVAEMSTNHALNILNQLKIDGIRRSEAVKTTVELCNLPKSDVYQLALDMSGWSEGDKDKK